MAIHLYFWQEKRDNGLENYGDLMSKYLVERISNRKVKTVTHPSKGLYKHLLKHYLVIGSILSSAQKKSVVWGSGIIKKDDTIREAKFLSVRGPRTRAAILEKGFQCPENYGDPALLMPKYYNPKIEKKYKLGIIPHYVDFKSINDRFKDNPDIKVINLLTNNVEKTTDEILECERTVSSSLHGVIVSHAYAIPSLWIKFSEKLSGDNIKFYDYFDSVGIHFKNIIEENPKQLTLKKIEDLLFDFETVLLPEKTKIEALLYSLQKTCPFK
ncbi:polysaccharide pyruvyl transferase family protein [Croceibacter atlanticus]|uniref:polysaccharide pyruvyl transferase family protein n=2 Tax=Croceibacter atlanticus TaxID=313588 RepID=UPI002354F99F|nr:polysaccharide pyruvyl transferase family protein [Croceibacter atlanticus]|tara:strand:+ start:488 stop:1297 length:810 start_codon:yes stop_codon:yes gene_type:complete